MKKLSFLLILALLTTGLMGCLTVETKEYSFKLKKGNSGEGRIKYINIMRSEDSATTIENDYDELINSYLKGNKPEDEILGVKNVKKRLFEEDNHLCGEITFEFDDITTLKFYKYKDDVWCYHIPASGFGIFGGSESFFSSNGTYGGENMPVVFWSGKGKEFEFKTTVYQPDPKNVSLLEIWKKNDGK
ncbi:MAG: hypothetical protein L0Y79_02370 [Chlorobi bacterium]|nr:hypothetical protein [Chlorobiota bacterium]MCI0717132.1 hypothetical protein [Chlorobiota bacterium]